MSDHSRQGGGSLQSAACRAFVSLGLPSMHSLRPSRPSRAHGQSFLPVCRFLQSGNTCICGCVDRCLVRGDVIRRFHGIYKSRSSYRWNANRCISVVRFELFNPLFVLSKCQRTGKTSRKSREVPCPIQWTPSTDGSKEIFGYTPRLSNHLRGRSAKTWAMPPRLQMTGSRVRNPASPSEYRFVLLQYTTGEGIW